MPKTRRADGQMGEITVNNTQVTVCHEPAAERPAAMTITQIATIRSTGNTRLHVLRDSRQPDRIGLSIEGKYGDMTTVQLGRREIKELIAALTSARTA